MQTKLEDIDQTLEDYVLEEGIEKHMRKKHETEDKQN
jgi:hypothetical protein